MMPIFEYIANLDCRCGEPECAHDNRYGELLPQKRWLHYAYRAPALLFSLIPCRIISHNQLSNQANSTYADWNYERKSSPENPEIPMLTYIANSIATWVWMVTMRTLEQLGIIRNTSPIDIQFTTLKSLSVSFIKSYEAAHENEGYTNPTRSR